MHRPNLILIAEQLSFKQGRNSDEINTAGYCIADAAFQPALTSPILAAKKYLWLELGTLPDMEKKDKGLQETMKVSCLSAVLLKG